LNKLVPESQNTEWKLSWRDEFLKWICGFANAEGGVLEVGRDDNGQAVGVTDAGRLLEDIPNKIRDVLALLPMSISFRRMAKI
jgi:ATP-dependent DNA helicase RecG